MSGYGRDFDIFHNTAQIVPRDADQTIVIRVPDPVSVVLRLEQNGQDLADLLLPEEEDDLLVREKVIDVTPMTEEQALVQTDLLGHDFYVFENATTGLINVVYHRKNGGYGIIKPRIETLDE